MRNIELIREVTTAAAGRWPDVLSLAGITVPQSPRQHSSCPACGGTDRFRFDDGGRGSHFCNQCGAGDGLDLVAKVNHCDTTEAARIVAGALGIDHRAADTDPKAASQRRNQLDTERQQREQDRQQQTVTEAAERRETFTAKYQALAAQARPGESEYLKSKGLTGFSYPILTDGSLLLELVGESGNHQQNGLEAATAALNDSLYKPQGDKVNAVQEATEDGKITARDSDPLKPRIESREGGIFWISPKVDRDSGEIINSESWLCSPLEVVGIGRGDNEQYLILRWQAAGGNTKTTQAIPLADIGEREGWRVLKAGGVNVTTKPAMRATLADWLQRSGSREIWRVAQATGWQCGAYIMPDGEIIGSPEMPVLFNGRSSAASGYTNKGTAESWRNTVARLAGGNYSMMTGIGAALAAPLIGLAGADGFGIHFYEQSSAGKTTTANIASSLYGNPDLLRLTWYGTALGLANEAAAHNDALMPLDEVGQGADPRSVAQSAYALFNGVGKLQGAKEGGNRDLKRWRTVAISTGETDLETFIANTGQKAKAGQLVRLLNIPLSKAVRFHDCQNGKQHADALKDAYQQNHGAAGREWIKWLADHQQQAVEAVREAESRWRSLIPGDYGEQVHRVGARFAIVEAALMLGTVVTGWDAQTCRDAIQHSFNAWVKEFGTGNKEHQQIVEQCEAFLNAHGLSRYAPIGYDPRDLPIRDLAGYRKKGSHESDPIIFYTFPATFEQEIAKGFNAKQFAEVLKGAGMLTPPTSGRGYQGRVREDGRQIRVYVLNFMAEESSQPEE